MRQGKFGIAIVMVGLVGGLSDNAYAQGAQGYPYGLDDPNGSSAQGVYELSKYLSQSHAQSPANSASAGSLIDGGVSLSGRSFNPNIWCPDGNANCNEVSTTDTTKINPGTRSIPVNSLAPMAGFQSIINSMAYSNQGANALVAPMTLMNVAMQLTEPGISAGLHMALNNTNQSLMNRYLANQAFMANAGVTSEGKLALRAYQACMAKRMGASSNAESWVSADANCQGDTNTNPTGVEPFNAVDSEGFNFGDDPDHRFNAPNEMGPPAPGAERIIRLTDYIFNSELQGNDEQASVTELRQTFIDAIGDIDLKVTPIVNGSRKLEYKKILPLTPADELYRRHTLIAYNTIHEMLHSLCVRRTNPDEARKDYFALPIAQEHLERLAVMGYMVQRSVIQAMYREYQESAGRSGVGNPTSRCDELQSWDSNKATSLERLSQGGSWGEQTKRLSRIVFSFAELIGRLKTMATYLSAEQVVKRMSSGTFDNTVRTLAFDLIYDVAGTRDIQLEYDKALAKLQSFAQLIVSENQKLNSTR